MKKTFTKKFILNNKGCYDTEDITQLYTERIEKGTVSLEEIMSSSVPTADKYWFLFEKCLSLKERKELFTLVMDGVYKITTDETVLAYITALKKYAAQKINYSSLYEAYEKTRVGWMVYYYSYCVSCSFLGFGLYFAQYLFDYLDRDSSTRELTWNLTLDYIKTH